MKWTHALRARLRLLFRGAAEARMDEEMRLHLEMEKEDNLRAGMSAEEARRRALVAFGGVEGHKESVRDGRTLAWMGGLVLDLKLGLRMLIKYPLLTVVGGIAITVATAIGVGASEFVRDMLSPELPLEEADRIVRVYQTDASDGDSAPASLYDLMVWRESLSALEDLGASATMEQGFRSDRGEMGIVSLARISASAFRVTRVPPLLGRFLLDSDEQPDAPPVVVLGYEAWQSLLGGDPNPMGRTVELGTIPTTVVGVMPEGYGFPASQNAWVPYRIDAAALQPETAPRAAIFARLAPDATMESAQAELDIAGSRAAADHPETYGQLKPRVTGFAERATSLQMALILSGLRVAFSLLLVVAAANVATLVFARMVTREGEIAVRASLGASRRRIVLQFFAEALVLVGVTTLLGLLLTRLTLGHISRLFFVIQQEPQPPFWWNDSLSASTVVYALVLAFLGAVIIGVVPGLKATHGALQPRLNQLSSGGGGGMRFGKLWTTIIVLQVALTVAFLPIALSVDVVADARADAGSVLEGAPSDFQPDDYLTAQLGRDTFVPPRTAEERTAFLNSSRRLFEEVRNRLAADPDVEAVAFASGLSGLNHIISPVEFVGGSGSSVTDGVRILLVDPAYLDLMNARVVAGQSLGPADFNAESRSVVVNEAFVEQFLDGQNPVGGQLRFPEREGGEASIVEVPASGTSVDIVGVVRNPGIDTFGPGAHPVIYAPLDLAPVNPRLVGLVGMPAPPTVQIFVKRRSESGAGVSLLHETVAAVDPSLRLSEVGTAADVWGPVHIGNRVGASIFLVVAAITLMLSVAGIYALMSFVVARRHREIAIRTAVGASRTKILSSIFGRAALQLLAGVALGAFVAVPRLQASVAEEGLRLLVIVATLLLAAGLAACLLPVRRALAIEPALAMKSE